MMVSVGLGKSYATTLFSLRISETSSFQHGKLPTYITFSSMPAQESTMVRAVNCRGSQSLESLQSSINGAVRNHLYIK